MIDKLLENKIFMYARGFVDGTDQVAIEAVNQNGDVLGTACALDAGDAQDELVGVLHRQGIRQQDIMWIESPELDPSLQAALARRVLVENKSPARTIAEHRQARAQHHTCSTCSHEPVCIVADATRRAPSLSVIVAGCLGYEPPAATSYEELVEQLAAATGERPRIDEKPPGQG